MNPVILNSIHTALDTLKINEGIEYIHVAESGSRAWGFASPDSDYDVRCIYRRSVHDYLRVFESRDTLEVALTDELDIMGWDIRKTLQLISRSNAVVFEWLQSPVVYTSSATERELLWNTAIGYFQPRICIHHYLGTVASAVQTINTDGTIRIKKYFYILRPLLAALWIARHNSVPPMEFGLLVPTLEDNPLILNIIDDLLAQKSESDEKAVIPLIPQLQEYIEVTRSYCNDHAKTLENRTHDNEMLNDVFRTLIHS